MDTGRNDMPTKGANKVTIVRNRKCRKSDVIVRFLEEDKIPFEVHYLGEEKIANELARKYGILASPGIIIGKKTVNPYELIEYCRVKNPEATREHFDKLIAEAENSS